MSQSAAFSVTVGSNLPTWLATLNLSIGQWGQVPSTALSAVAGVSSVPGNIGRIAIVTAWNGCAVDRRDATIWKAACGGHTDYAGNEVYSLTLANNSPAWVLRRNTTTSTSNSYYYSDGRPGSTHTYSQQVFCEQINRVMRVGHGARYSDGFDATYMDGFNPSTNDWDPQGTYPNVSPTLQINMQDWGAEVDPTTGDIYATSLVSGTYTARRWNRATNTWSSLGTMGNGRNPTSAWDTTRNRGIFICNGATVAMTSSGVSNVSFSGGSPGTATGMVYIPSLDVFLSKGGGANVSQHTGAGLVTTSYPTTGGGSIPSPPSNGSYNSFKYCPSLGIVAYVPSYTGNVWVLKVHNV